jgi:hypothetical protein
MRLGFGRRLCAQRRWRKERAGNLAKVGAYSFCGDTRSTHGVLDKSSQRTRGFSAMTVERFTATISSGIAFTREDSAV